METFLLITSIIMASVLMPLAFGLFLSNMNDTSNDEELVSHLAHGGVRTRFVSAIFFSPIVIAACMLGLYQKDLKDKSLVGLAHTIALMGYCLLISLVYRWHLVS